MTLVSSWRRRGAFAAILAAAVAGAALVLASATVTAAQTAPSATIKPITLSGAEENPAVTANATGSFNAVLTDGKLEFDLSAVGPNITQAHIHQGAKGSNGPVVAFLFGPSDPAVGAIHPTGTLTVTNLVGPLKDKWKGFTDALAKGELYVNVHSKENPAGMVRAQIPATTLAPLPPNTGDSVNARTTTANFELAAGVLLLVAAGGSTVMVLSRRRGS